MVGVMVVGLFSESVGILYGTRIVNLVDDLGECSVFWRCHAHHRLRPLVEIHIALFLTGLHLISPGPLLS